MERFGALYTCGVITTSGLAMRAYWNHLKGWITVAVVLFGIAFLDSEFKPLNDLEDFLNSALVLGVIFAGDVLWNWIKTQISR